jgi:hypothetical protein
MTRAVRRIISGMRSRDSGARRGPFGTVGADLHAMREYNRLLVLNSVRNSGPIARVVIAQQSAPLWRSCSKMVWSGRERLAA